MEILSAKNVSYVYQEKIDALCGISFSVEKGEFVAILGPNGSGKSTLLNILSGVYKPTRGEVSIQGENIGKFSRKEIARRISYVPQNVMIDFPFTCREIVLMGRFAHLSGLGIESSADLDIAKKAMEMTGITEIADRMIHHLSGGERQRVFIAQAVAAQPQILMLDEPVSSLDIRYKVQILNLLKKLNIQQKITIVAILHDLNLALQYCDRVIALKQGKLVREGEPAAILSPEIIQEVYGIKVRKIYGKAEGEFFITPEVERFPT